jgi:hypothetical protein
MLEYWPWCLASGRSMVASTVHTRPKQRHDANGLAGSMGLNGMSVLIAARHKYPDVSVVETHPKVLYWALANKRYDYQSARDDMGLRGPCRYTHDDQRARIGRGSIRACCSTRVPGPVDYGSTRATDWEGRTACGPMRGNKLLLAGVVKIGADGGQVRFCAFGG